MLPSILVTGGAGYIGSHACVALLESGFCPVVLDDLSTGHLELLQDLGVLLIKGNTGDRTLVDEILREQRISAVMHFAAHAYVGESVTAPSKYYRNNFAHTVVLLDAMVAAGVDKIVFSSTCATYGIPGRVPITEDEPQEPINPYGWTKFFVERVLRDYEVAYGLRHVALRYFNAAGADSKGRLGEDHDPETHLIPLALFAAAGKSDHLQIFGQDYDTPDGSCVRDYIHVADLCTAHVKALERLLAGEGSTALNLGSGTGHSVFDVVRTVEEVTGLEVPIRLRARRAGDPPVLVADPARAREALEWRPERSELRVIVEDAWRWHRKRHLNR
jgi:UDP-glucose 4-epimerase